MIERIVILIVEHQAEIAAAVTSILAVCIRNREKRQLRRSGKLFDEKNTTITKN